MGRVEGEGEKEGVAGVLANVIDDPVLASGSEQVGCVAAFQLAADLTIVMPDLLRRAVRRAIAEWPVVGRIVEVSVAVSDVAVEGIKASLGRIGRPILGGEVVILAVRGPLQTVLAHEPGAVAGRFHHGCKRVVVRECLIELVVTNLGMSLMDATEQRRSAGGADGRRTVVCPQLHALGGHRVEHRGAVPLWVVGQILVQHTKVPPAHVVEQDEDDIRFGRSLGSSRDRCRREEQEKSKRSERGTRNHGAANFR